MSKSKRLVFFGNERLATGVTTSAPTLSSLIDHGYDVAALVVNNAEARSRKSRQLEVAAVAEKNNVPIIYSGQISVESLQSYNAEVGILAAYGRIVPSEIINLFPRGIVNIHPSLLPKYRGSTPIEQTILDGETETGVSLMRLAPKMDAGPIYAQAKLPLSGLETKQELANQLLELGSHLLVEKLPGIIDGSLKPGSQNNSFATYTKQIEKKDGVIDWQKPAVQLEREVRAYAGWPRSHTNIFNQDIIINKARVAIDATDGGLVLKCSPGYLEIQELIAPSGRQMSGVDFIRGYYKRS